MLIFAHRYLYRHDKRRKIMRRAAKDGLAIVKEINKDGTLYEITQEHLSKLRKFK